MSRSPLFVLMFSVVVCAGMWMYVARVLVPQQKEYAAIHSIPRGNLSDLYPRWLGSRELLLNRRDPYLAEITREIQSGYYGRPLDSARPNDPHDQEAFAYPVYVAFVLAPAIQLPFGAVQASFRWLLAGLTVLSLVFWLRVASWQLSWRSVAPVVLLTFATFPVVQGIHLQQLSLLVAALIAGCVYALCTNRQVLAGILLALATIKPQLAVPLAAWLLLWSVSRLTSRWKFAAWFSITLSALILGGEVLLPGWIHEFYSATLAYRSYTGATSILDQLGGRTGGPALTLAVVLAVALAVWRARKSVPDAADEIFRCTTFLVLAATVVIVPSNAPYNQLLLLPGALLIVQTWNNFAGSAGAGFRILRAIAAACVVWPWISATTLALASVFMAIAGQFWQVPLWTSPFLPIPLAACLGLYAAKPGIRLPHATTSR